MAQNEVIVSAAKQEAEAALDPLDSFFATDRETYAYEAAYGDASTTRALRGARNVIELLGFWVANEEYAVNITEIEEIIKIPLITEVPRTHRSVLGIISLRGTIVPIIDLRVILGLDRQPIETASRILVLQGGGDPVGLLVDRVTNVMRLNQESIEAAPASMARESNDMIRGVGRLDDHLLIILDVGAVLTVVEGT